MNNDGRQGLTSVSGESGEQVCTGRSARAGLHGDTARPHRATFRRQMSNANQRCRQIDGWRDGKLPCPLSNVSLSRTTHLLEVFVMASAAQPSEPTDHLSPDGCQSKFRAAECCVHNSKERSALGRTSLPKDGLENDWVKRFQKYLGPTSRDSPFSNPLIF